MSNVRLAAEITAAFLENNRVRVEEVGDLIRSIHRTLSTIDQPVVEAREEPKRLTSAQVKRSITDDALISFIDGKPYRQLKRHLTTKGMTPEQYRARFGLPQDYPMVAPSYSRQRSELARASGLGRNARKAPAGRKKKG